MKKHIHLIAGTFTAIALLFSLPATAEGLDFGDHSSATITGKAWGALGKENWKDAIAYADKCIELHGKEAEKMQKKLKDFADEDSAHDHWALNDVGTCYFIKAKAFASQKKKKEAIAAYTTLKTKLQYAQCWDSNGWFWHPAEAADEALAELKD